MRNLSRLVFRNNLRTSFSTFIPCYELPILLNDNLRFNANDYELFLVPRHPRMQKNTPKTLAIDTESVVIELFFLKQGQEQQELSQVLTNNRVIKLQFKHLGQVLDIQSGKGQQQYLSYLNKSVQIPRKELYRIKDRNQNKLVEFTIKSGIDEWSKGDNKSHLDASINYEDFTIMQEIIKESLYDLSGYRLIMDIKRKQQLDKVIGGTRQITNFKRQSESYYKNK